MLKVKDWPPQDDLRTRLVRHAQDFDAMLPVPMWTHPLHGPLNMATLLPDWTNRTDLGPKTYIAYGQVWLVASYPCFFI